jgi:aminotransferase in exopolysaccharide biosynthesis
MFSHIIDFIRSLYPNKDSIPLHEPCFRGKENEYVNAAIDSTFVSSVGEFVERFEEMIKNIVGARCAVATVNGTSALHVALKLAGVESGNEVITQPVSFVATANAISYCGAKPVFLDVERETLGLNPDALSNFFESHCELIEGECFNKISGKKIAACVPMHTFGHPCRIDRICHICNEFNVPVVEDAAESLGSIYASKQTGSFGLLGIFSLNGNKTVTSGGGGVIVTNDENIAQSAKHIITTAKAPHPYEYIHDTIGYNYRMPNINAALACAQLEQLGFIIEKKRELARIYKEFFKTVGVEFVEEPENAVSNYWLNAIVLQTRDQRDGFLKKTNGVKVMTRPIWRLLSKLDMYENCQTDSLKNSQWLEERVVNIPSSVPL